MAELVGLSAVGYDVPATRQIVGFICIAVIPGFLLLRLLKLDWLGVVETILYSAGLSIAFVMFLGLIVNALYPLIGIAKPISLLPLFITLVLAILVMCAVIYFRERKQQISPRGKTAIKWQDVINPPVLWLLLLPILSVLGVFLAYYHQGNILLLAMLSFIVITVILIAFTKFIPPRLYPLAVFSISISLLWQITLVSPSLAGYDIHYHYYLQNLIISNGVWDPSLGTMSNSMMSIVILAPFQSLLLNMDGAWVFKIIYPLLFTLVPLALFQVIRKQSSDKVAFFGAFLFISLPSFFFTVPMTATQMIGEIFFALLILILLNNRIVMTQRVVLLIMFSCALVVSHYGTSYIYLLYLGLVIPFMLLWRSDRADRFWGKMTSVMSKVKKLKAVALWAFKPPDVSGPGRQLRVGYIMLFFVICLAWYLYSSSGYTFQAIVNIGGRVVDNIATDLFVLESRDPMILQALGQTAMRGAEFTWELARYFQYATQAFIVVGVVGLVVDFRNTKFHPVYIAMTLASAVILVLCIVLPYFASALNMDRIYHINLFFLAPFGILGGIAVFKWVYNLFTLRRLRSMAISAALGLVVVVVLAPYFLFSSGFIFEITGATPTNMALSLYKYDANIFTQAEVNAGNRLGEFGAGFIIYADPYGATHLGQYVGAPTRLPEDLTKVRTNSYIFLRQWNVAHNEILSYTGIGAQVNHTYIKLDSGIGKDMLSGRGLIYDNGDARVFGSR
jgi:uncharacterized membrane protein